MDSSKNRAATATAVGRPVYRTQPPAHSDTATFDHTHPTFRCAAGLGWPYVWTLATGQTTVPYVWRLTTFMERVTTFRLPLLFLSSHKGNECLCNSFHTASHCNNAEALQRAFRQNQGSLLFRSTDSQRCTAGAVEDARVSGCKSS